MSVKSALMNLNMAYFSPSVLIVGYYLRQGSYVFIAIHCSSVEAGLSKNYWHNFHQIRDEDGAVSIKGAIRF